MGKSKQKQRKLGTYGIGLPSLITLEVVESQAYQVLSPMERLILIDMLRTYAAVSHWDRLPPSNGFTYTFSHCRERVSHKTFYSALDHICSAGFFQYPPAIQSNRPNAPRRFLHCVAWASYVPCHAKRTDTENRKVRKAARLRRDQKRKTDYLAIGKEKWSGKKVTDTSSKKVTDTGTIIPWPCSKKVTDTDPKTDTSV